MIIDATNLILGRLGTYVAKKALLGNKIDIVNCENSVVTGHRNRIFNDYEKSFKRGIPSKGPFFNKMPDRFVKRSIRGMLTYKKERGRKAFEGIKCHIGIPESFKNEKFDTIKNASLEKLPNHKYIKIKDICNHFGANIK